MPTRLSQINGRSVTGPLVTVVRTPIAAIRVRVAAFRFRVAGRPMAKKRQRNNPGLKGLMQSTSRKSTSQREADKRLRTRGGKGIWIAFCRYSVTSTQ